MHPPLDLIPVAFDRPVSVREYLKLPVQGAPSWVTVGLVCKTGLLLSKKYGKRPSVAESLDAILTVGRLVEMLEPRR